MAGEVQKIEWLCVIWFLAPPPTRLRRGTLTEKYDDGKINTLISIKGNLSNGAYTKYYQNGKKQIEGEYYKIQQSGLWSYYKIAELNLTPE